MTDNLKTLLHPPPPTPVTTILDLDSSRNTLSRHERWDTAPSTSGKVLHPFPQQLLLTSSACYTPVIYLWMHQVPSHERWDTALTTFDKLFQKLFYPTSLCNRHCVLPPGTKVLKMMKGTVNGRILDTGESNDEVLG